MGRVFLNDYSQGRKAPCTGEKGGGLRSFMKNEMGPVGVLTSLIPIQFFLLGPFFRKPRVREGWSHLAKNIVSPAYRGWFQLRLTKFPFAPL